MDVITTCDEARQRVWSLRSGGNSVGLVPTMGALHEGHLSLVRKSVDLCDATIASIFVNPTQFGPQEDLDEYPRTLEQDLALLDAAGVAMVFTPTMAEMYPDGFSTYVNPPEVARSLEGVCRPGHFRGVVTVVMKLFQSLPATRAVFGLKDYQQLKVIEAMSRDLNVGIEIVAGETIREADGLALSSRNRYLSSQDRIRALSISAALQMAAEEVDSGQRDVSALETLIRTRLSEGVDHIEYARIVDAETLARLDQLDRSAVALIAARIGSTRLIDNRVFVREQS